MKRPIVRKYTPYIYRIHPGLPPNLHQMSEKFVDKVRRFMVKTACKVAGLPFYVDVKLTNATNAA